MKYIYRIENTKGHSCYNWNYLTAIEKVLNDPDWFCEANNRPQPHGDIGIDRYPFKHEICGFKNVRQALKWFKAKEIKSMRRLGFDIKKISVKQITAIGECQVLAIK